MEAPRPDAAERRTRRPIRVPDEELEAAAARAAAEAEAARRAQHAAWRNPRTALLAGLRHQGGTIWYTPKYKGYVTKDWSMKHGHHGQRVQIVCNVRGQVVGLSRTFAGHRTDIYMLKHSPHIINALKFTVTQEGREVTQAHPTMTDGGYQGLGAIIGDRNHIRPKRKPPRGQLSEDDKLYNAQVYAKRQLNERVIGRIKAVMGACTKQWQGHRRKDVRKMSPLMCWAGDVHIAMFPMNRELPEDYAEAPADEPDEDMEDEEASGETSSASESGSGGSTG